jgi:hypothetical protein
MRGKINETTVFYCGIGIGKKNEIVINKMIKRTRIAVATVPFNNISMGFIDWIIYFSRVFGFCNTFFGRFLVQNYNPFDPDSMEELVTQHS